MAFLQFLAAAAPSVIGAVANARSNNKNRNYNQSLADSQNQKNLDQWHRENAYNSPLAQMQRFQNAGLNPNLAYGQQNMSAQSPMMSSGQPSNPVDISAFTTAYQNNINQSRMVDAQIALLNSQKDKTDAERDNISTDTKIKAIEVRFNEDTYSPRVEQIQAQVKNLNTQTDELIKRCQSLDLSNAYQTIVNSWADKNFARQYRLMGFEIKEAISRISLNKSQQKLNDAIKGWNDFQVGRAFSLLPLEMAGMELGNQVQAAQFLNISYDSAKKFFEASHEAFDLEFDKENKEILEYLNARNNLVGLTQEVLSFPHGKGKPKFKGKGFKGRSGFIPYGMGMQQLPYPTNSKGNTWRF